MWSYTSAYAHLQICLELAAKETHGVALKYDELCRLEWQECAKRGGHDYRSGCAACWCFVFVISGDEDFDINVVSRVRNEEIARDARGTTEQNGARKSGKGAAISIEQ